MNKHVVSKHVIRWGLEMIDTDEVSNWEWNKHGCITINVVSSQCNTLFAYSELDQVLMNRWKSFEEGKILLSPRRCDEWGQILEPLSAENGYMRIKQYT